ncbi:hypothetical protein PAHAL_7G117900 [Panicum hallii]|uniref:Uncharacterized protein n=1 Tax=Panicum hallii TaxID=206008 RepID=A0A2S3I5W0_9POAL|nr:hypothetical protein PAHAL_7G117900 [Panicum hallii]
MTIYKDYLHKIQALPSSVRISNSSILPPAYPEHLDLSAPHHCKQNNNFHFTLSCSTPASSESFIPFYRLRMVTTTPPTFRVPFCWRHTS